MRRTGYREQWDPSQTLGAHLYWNLDLYLDVRTFRLRRLLLWDGAARAPIHWRVLFDYSKFNEPTGVVLPKTRGD